MAVEQFKTTTPTIQRVAVYAALLRGAHKHGKPDEVAKTQALLDFFEGQLDETYRKEAVSFTVEKAASRKSKSTRIVLVELFTTAEARPCIAADMAFDAGRSIYPTTDAVFLRYHVPVNAPDLLTSPAALARREFYSADIEETVPAALVDGQMTSAIGGSSARGKACFDVLRKSIDTAREKQAEAQIVLEWREGSVHAKVSNLSETGDKVRLRFAVVEQEVRYVGASGQRLHGQVVRGFLGNAAGIKLDRKDSTHSATLDVAALRKSLASYLAEHARKETQRVDPPLKLNTLAIVAFVQHEDTKKVYGVARIALPARK